MLQREKGKFLCSIELVQDMFVPYIKLKLEKSDVSYANFGPLQCDEEQKKYQVQVMEEMLESKGYEMHVA